MKSPENRIGQYFLSTYLLSEYLLFETTCKVPEKQWPPEQTQPFLYGAFILAENIK